MAQRRSGFTLIELLIFAGIFALIIGAFITILIGTVGVQSSSSAQNEVATQGQDILQQIQYYVKQARLVDMPLDTATGTLVLRESASTNDPTTFTLATGTVYLQQGVSGAPQALSSPRVSVSNLSFTRHFNLNSTSSPYGTESVTYSFTVTTQGGSQAYSQAFGSSAVVLNPVPIIALLQHAQAEQNSGSPASISAGLPRPVEAGDLLLAVTANQSGATSSISDTSGNTWSLAASTSYPAYSSTLALFYAANASSGVTTATAAFASGGGKNPSLFLFEYRGAATSSVLDVAGGQIQSSTLNPVTPFVSPSESGSVELLFGINMLGSPTNIAGSAGPGFALEASSTGGYSTQIFAEDMNQYIENPVSASWSLSGAASSSALIATFASALPSYDTTGLVGYWTLNEGTGTTAYDASGNGMAGTWAGTVPYYTTGNGQSYAGNFNGSNDYIALPASSVLNVTGAITLSAWVKTTGSDLMIVGGYQDASPYNGYAFGIKGSNIGWNCSSGSVGSVSYIDGGATGSWICSTGTVNDGNWHLVTVVADGSNVNFYIDGSLSNTVAYAYNPQSYTGQRAIGAMSDGSADRFSGAMDHVRIYNRLLSATEIQELYSARQ